MSELLEYRRYLDYSLVQLPDVLKEKLQVHLDIHPFLNGNGYFADRRMTVVKTFFFKIGLETNLE